MQNVRVSFRRALAGYHVGDVRRFLCLLELQAEESEKEIDQLRSQLLECTRALESVTTELEERREECVRLTDETGRARAALRVLRIERTAPAEHSESNEPQPRAADWHSVALEWAPTG